MTRSTNSTFAPAWASPPGETLDALIEDNNVDRHDLAMALGQSEDWLTELLNDRVRLTPEIAESLSNAVGGSPWFWLNRDQQYREDLARLRARDSSADIRDWLKSLPVRDMKRLGWINRDASNDELVAECLRFFGVDSVMRWHREYHPIVEKAAFRTSRSYSSNGAAVATWLRKGEIDAANVECAGFDSAKLRSLIPEARSLSRVSEPAKFLPRLKSMMAQAGVAVVVARAPSGCRASGATMFLSDGKALALFSIRYLSDDQFWFTFFHEMAHLVLHEKSDLFIEESEGEPEEEENEANEFAADCVIPRKYREQFEKLPVNYRAIVRFARKVGVSPGLVVGQMQHLGRIGHDKMNGLKRRYSWD